LYRGKFLLLGIIEGVDMSEQKILIILLIVGGGAGPPPPRGGGGEQINHMACVQSPAPHIQRLKRLDRSFFKPLKTYDNKKMQFVGAEKKCRKGDSIEDSRCKEETIYLERNSTRIFFGFDGNVMSIYE
jgi:hypothetical protein